MTGDDAQKILEIIRDWAEEFNDIGGLDAGDLMWRLKESGYTVPETDD